MGAPRLGVGIAVLVAIAAACSEPAPEPTTSTEKLAEPPRVPNPPPRYAHSDPGGPVPTGDVDPDAGMSYRCGGRTPFACPLDDGTFVCMETPCLPDCSRIGCVGGEVCRACEGGFRCIDPQSGC